MATKQTGRGDSSPTAAMRIVSKKSFAPAAYSRILAIFFCVAAAALLHVGSRAWVDLSVFSLGSAALDSNRTAVKAFSFSSSPKPTDYRPLDDAMDTSIPAAVPETEEEEEAPLRDADPLLGPGLFAAAAAAAPATRSISSAVQSPEQLNSAGDWWGKLTSTLGGGQKVGRSSDAEDSDNKDGERIGVPSNIRPLPLKPQTQYLGVLLDAGRHYYPPRWIKKLLDALYILRYNLVHFRLTDDQAFAVNLTSQPNLAMPAFGYNATYSVEELRDLVTYAQARNITLMPEVNVPGHAGGWGNIPGLILNCPKFACTKAYGIPLDISNPKLLGVIRDVLAELKDIFQTSDYFHLGGDEVHMAMPCFRELGLQMFDYNGFEQDLKKILEEVGIPQAKVLRWEMSGQKANLRAGEMTHWWLSHPSDPNNRATATNAPYFTSASLYMDTDLNQNAWDLYGRARDGSLTKELPLPTAIVAGTFELGTEEWFEKNLVGRLLGIAMAATGTVYANATEFGRAYDHHCHATGMDPRLCQLRGTPTDTAKHRTMNWRPVMRGKWERIMCEKVKGRSAVAEFLESSPATMSLEDHAKSQFVTKNIIAKKPSYRSGEGGMTDAVIDKHSFDSRSNGSSDPCLCQKNTCSPDVGNKHGATQQMSCHRGILTVHKMGHDAFNELNERLPFKVESPQICQNHTFCKRFTGSFPIHPKSTSWRHIVATRDFYEALRSGYLYHKSGKECWLDWFGKPGHHGWLMPPNEEFLRWGERLTRTQFQWIPINGRNLCQYLADESEEDGLRVYMEWALDSFFQPLIDFTIGRRQAELTLGVKKTKFVCFDSIYTKDSNDFARELSNWLFPGLSLAPKQPRMATKSDEEKKSGHGTTKDPTVRARLKDIIKRLDDRVFNGTFAQGHDLFGCDGWR